MSHHFENMKKRSTETARLLLFVRYFVSCTSIYTKHLKINKLNLTDTFSNVKIFKISKKIYKKSFETYFFSFVEIQISKHLAWEYYQMLQSTRQIFSVLFIAVQPSSGSLGLGRKQRYCRWRHHPSLSAIHRVKLSHRRTVKWLNALNYRESLVDCSPPHHRSRSRSDKGRWSSTRLRSVKLSPSSLRSSPLPHPLPPCIR